MTTTTSYGSWITADPGNLTLTDSVTVALGDHADDHDIDAICSDYRAAINDALPDGVSLHGDEFYGPYPARVFDGYPVTEDGDRLDLRAIVEGVDFWAIAERHDTSQNA